MPLELDIDRLARVPLFSSLGQDALRLLAFSAESYPYASGQFLFRRGETADGGYLIVSGLVDLLSTDNLHGDRRIVGPGTLIGEHALLAETVRPVSARAGKPTSTLKISRAMFVRVLKAHPEDALIIREAWARRLHAQLTAS